MPLCIVMACYIHIATALFIVTLQWKSLATSLPIVILQWASLNDGDT